MLFSVPKSDNNRTRRKKTENKKRKRSLKWEKIESISLCTCVPFSIVHSYRYRKMREREEKLMIGIPFNMKIVITIFKHIAYCADKLTNTLSFYFADWSVDVEKKMFESHRFFFSSSKAWLVARLLALSPLL